MNIESREDALVAQERESRNMVLLAVLIATVSTAVAVIIFIFEGAP